MGQMEMDKVYFVKAGGFLKIGRAENVSVRISGIQTDCPHEVTLIGTIDDGDKEGWAHYHLHRYRVRGEWFVLSQFVERMVYGWLRDPQSLKRPRHLKNASKKITRNLHAIDNTRDADIAERAEIIGENASQRDHS